MIRREASELRSRLEDPDKNFPTHSDLPDYLMRWVRTWGLYERLRSQLDSADSDAVLIQLERAEVLIERDKTIAAKLLLDGIDEQFPRRGAGANGKRAVQKRKKATRA